MIAHPRFLAVPRTGSLALRLAWSIKYPELRGHDTAVYDGEDFRYGFTRNPWDRVVSLYFHLRGERPGESTEIPFRDWVLAGGLDSRRCAPTLDWLQHADWVGRFENRADDLSALASVLGREDPGALKFNEHTRLAYPAYYDEELIKIVGERYAADVERFGYTFDPGAMR